MTKLEPRAPIRQVVTELLDVAARAGRFTVSTADRTELEAKIQDAFERGAASEALGQLLSRSPGRSPRTEQRLATLIESALLALGVDPRKADAGFAALLQKHAPPPLDGAPDLRRPPIRDAFTGLRMPISASTPAALADHSFALARLEASLKAALEAPDSLSALRGLEKRIDLSRAPDRIIGALLTSYVEREAWPDVIRVFEAAPAEFKTYPLAAQNYALALSLGHRELDALRVLRTLEHAGVKEAGIFGLRGMMMKSRYDRALAENKPQAAAVYLDRAIAAYEDGADLEPAEVYPAINLPLLYELRGDPQSLARAKQVARLVSSIAERRATSAGFTYQDSATMMMMSIVRRDDDEARRWVERALACPTEPWRVRSTAENLGRLLRVRRARGESGGVLEEVIKRLESHKPVPKPRGVTKAPDKRDVPDGLPMTAADKLSVMLEQTYRFGARSPKWLSGNYAFKGIAHDVRVTPADMAYFIRIVEAAGLAKEPDVLKANAGFDSLIRARFDTDKMEDISSGSHQRYDAAMPALAKLMGSRKASSITNVSADWINGLGDCRQHAPVKMVLFEAWKRLRRREGMLDLGRALQGGREADAARIEQELKKLNTWELRVLDAEIVDVKTGKMIEPHTLTLLVERELAPHKEVMTELSEVRLADSFYHHVYPLASGPVDLEIKDGQLWIPIPGTAADGREIALRPAVYSYDRSSPSIDYGQLEFRGVQVASPGWAKEVPVEGVDLDYLHQLALDKTPAPPAKPVRA